MKLAATPLPPTPLPHPPSPHQPVRSQAAACCDRQQPAAPVQVLTSVPCRKSSQQRDRYPVMSSWRHGLSKNHARMSVLSLRQSAWKTSYPTSACYHLPLEIYALSRARQFTQCCDVCGLPEKQVKGRGWVGGRGRREGGVAVVCWLTSQQHASVSQGRIYSDSWTCCHTDMEAADQSFYLAQPQYADTWPTSPRADPTTPGTWQGSH